MWRECMDARAILIGTLVLLISILIMLLILHPRGFLLKRLIRSRRERKLSAQVRATITQIQIEASTLSSWWKVTVVYRDPQTCQVLTFHSPHLAFRPKQQVGD